jgi:hypothetical protein
MSKRQPPIWSKQGQGWANLTGKSTQAVRTADGMVRFTVADWPIEGTQLGSFEPQQEESR